MSVDTHKEDSKNEGILFLVNYITNNLCTPVCQTIYTGIIEVGCDQRLKIEKETIPLILSSVFIVLDHLCLDELEWEWIGKGSPFLHHVVL